MKSTKKKHMKGDMNTSYQNVNTTDEKNKLAEELLFEAWEAAGYHGQSGEDFYPRTSNETKTMDTLLSQAESSIDDPSDTDLMEAIAETREVIDWSKKRHWTFAWWIIICVAIVGFYNIYQTGSEEDYVKTQKALTATQVQEKLNSAIGHTQKNIEYYTSQLTIDTLSKETRKDYEKYLKNQEKKAKELQSHDTASYKKVLIKKAAQRVSAERWEAIWCFIWIALYIFACRPRGYMITKRRREEQVYTGLKKILFGIAGGLVGAAGALYVTETVTKWSDGSKTRDDDSFMIYGMKLGLIALAVIIVLVAARIVIVIATILGLIRNYDWKQLLKDPKALLHDIK